MKQRLALFMSFAACLAFAATPAFAGKGGSGGGGGAVTPSISLSQSTGAAAAQPTLGSWVAFSTVIPSNVKNPRVEVLCSQNGALVYGEAGSPADSFLLGGGGSLWLTNGGAASCVANLYYFGQVGGQSTAVYLATTSFNAA
jgi:hypothetical protein